MHTLAKSNARVATCTLQQNLLLRRVSISFIALFTQVQRCYYGSKADFLADCQLLVDAARAYNTPGRGGRQATPALINAAQGLFDEGLRVLGQQDNLEYWEKRVEVRQGIWLPVVVGLCSMLRMSFCIFEGDSRCGSFVPHVDGLCQ
jgi:hypothetical protein